MKLYLSPDACSLAGHIALNEAGLAFDRITVDLETRRTGSGEDYRAVNPKGYVPALVLDDGQVLTETVAILAWIAERAPMLAPDGDLWRIRLVEMLAFLAMERHKPLVRCFYPIDDADKADAAGVAAQRLAFIAGRLQADHLLGSRFTVADAYLYVMLRWARELELAVPVPLPAFVQRVETRPAVQRALQDEGLG